MILIAAPKKVTKITKATFCLHNYLKISEAQSSNRPYCSPGYADHEDSAGNLVPGNWRLETADAIQVLEATHTLVQQQIYVTQ